MKINSRTKGHAGEREIANLLNQELGCNLKRNLQQTRNGGCDLIDESGLLENLAIEVKRGKRYLSKWWQQTIDQAMKINKLPVLAYKLDYADWIFEVPFDFLNKDLYQHYTIINTAKINLNGFVYCTREFINQDKEIEYKLSK